MGDKTYSVLVADDQEDVCDVIEMCLESIEEIEKVHTVHDGLSAQEYIMKNNLDLVLLDIEMPKKDGLSVVEYVLKEKKISPEKIIILSGQLHTDRLKNAAKLGINNIMPKPFKQDSLIQKIKSIL